MAMSPEERAARFEAARQETEQLKRDFNVVEYLKAQGFEETAKSSKRTPIYGNGGTKFIIGRSQDGIQTAKAAPFDGGHKPLNGIDLVAELEGVDFKEAKRRAAQFMGGGYTGSIIPKAEPKPQKAEPTAEELAKVKELCNRHAPLSKFNKVLESRGLTPETIGDPRFGMMTRQTSRGAVAFLQRLDPDIGLSSLQYVNADGSKVNAKDGLKGLWVAGKPGPGKDLVVTESPIDGMSHAQLCNDGGRGHESKKVYVATMGNLSPRGVRCLNELVKASRSVISALDNDASGERFHARLSEMAQAAGKTITRDAPRTGKDFNEVLQAERMKMQEARQGNGKSIERGRGGICGW